LYWRVSKCASATSKSAHVRMTCRPMPSVVPYK
jgi:hypothetical protein